MLGFRTQYKPCSAIGAPVTGISLSWKYKLRPPGVHWDLWALAVVAYEALAGRLPFETSSTDEWRRAVVAGQFEPLNASLEDVPEAWQEFFADCFAPDRAERPRSAADFFRRLEKALA